MAMVVVKGAVIRCGHGGQLRLTAGDQRLTVSGNGAVTSGMEAGLAFGSPVAPLPGLAPCTAALTDQKRTPAPCVTAAALPAGLATKLSVGGTPVVLDSASGQTVTAAGPSTWSVSDAGQQKLEGV